MWSPPLTSSPLTSGQTIGWGEPSSPAFTSCPSKSGHTQLAQRSPARPALESSLLCEVGSSDNYRVIMDSRHAICACTSQMWAVDAVHDCAHCAWSGPDIQSTVRYTAIIYRGGLGLPLACCYRNSLMGRQEAFLALPHCEGILRLWVFRAGMQTLLEARSMRPSITRMATTCGRRSSTTPTAGCQHTSATPTLWGSRSLWRSLARPRRLPRCTPASSHMALCQVSTCALIGSLQNTALLMF